MVSGQDLTEDEEAEAVDEEVVDDTAAEEEDDEAEVEDDENAELVRWLDVENLGFLMVFCFSETLKCVFCRLKKRRMKRRRLWLGR